MVVYGVQLVTIILLRVHLMRRNVLKRREQSNRQSGETRKEDSVGGPLDARFFWQLIVLQDAGLAHKHAFDDLTDQENPECTLPSCIQIDPY